MDRSAGARRDRDGACAGRAQRGFSRRSRLGWPPQPPGPSPAPSTRQDFGHRASNRAGGKEPGEIGGRIQRSATPASYAKVIPERTLDARLTASGKFAVRSNDGGSGMLFGWFHDTSRGWRTPNSLAFRIDGNGGKYWVFFEYGTRNWLTGGGETWIAPAKGHGFLVDSSYGYGKAMELPDGCIRSANYTRERHAPLRHAPLNLNQA